MASPRIYTKELLKSYILRKLGSPVINIELTDDQLEDAIYDTIEEFVQRAYSGVNERIYVIPVSAGVQEYILPYETFAVLGVYDGGNIMGVGGATPTQNPFHVNNYLASDLFGSGNKLNLVQYEIAMEMIETLNLILGKKITYDFNTWSKVLYLFETMRTESNNKNIMVHVYKKLELEEGYISSLNTQGETSNLYDAKWVKRMATEKARYQWAINIMKYEGSTLPNGLNFNSAGILQEAKEKIEILMNELYSEYELPPDFFIG